mmetsp:Transcript_34176/g.67596  ORF Transcript_34176/g.67596 Transcript_34176/m.67596 type:complete len:210 (-) Transcript_34176:346-975(-)
MLILHADRPSHRRCMYRTSRHGRHSGTSSGRAPRRMKAVMHAVCLHTTRGEEGTDRRVRSSIDRGPSSGGRDPSAAANTSDGRSNRIRGRALYDRPCSSHGCLGWDRLSTGAPPLPSTRMHGGRWSQLDFESLLNFESLPDPLFPLLCRRRVRFSSRQSGETIQPEEEEEEDREDEVFEVDSRTLTSRRSFISSARTFCLSLSKRLSRF